MVPPDMVSPDKVPPDMVSPDSRFKFFGHIYKFKVRTLKEWLRKHSPRVNKILIIK